MLECFHDKWRRRDVAAFLGEYQTDGENLSTTAIREMILADKESVMYLVDRASEGLAREIRERNITLAEIEYSTRFDESSQKYREIGVESIKQQVYNYIAVNGLMELLVRKVGTYQCASIPGRGQVYGKRAIERWIRRNPEKTRHGAKADIRHCYPSINIDKLMSLLRKQVKNEDLLYLIDVLVHSYKQGLSIGSYLSQWLCNYFLSFAYRYVSQNCFKVQTRRGKVKRTRLYYKILFYMDDMLILGSRKADVKKTMQMLCKFLNDELGLTVKPNWKLFKVDYIDKDGKHHGDCIDMMGYKIYRDHTEVRRSIFLRARRAYVKMMRYASKGLVIPKKLAHKCISYYGWFKHSDSIYFMQKYSIKQLFHKSKRWVNKYDKSKIYRGTASCVLAAA